MKKMMAIFIITSFVMASSDVMAVDLTNAGDFRLELKISAVENTESFPVLIPAGSKIVAKGYVEAVNNSSDIVDISGVDWKGRAERAWSNNGERKTILPSPKDWVVLIYSCQALPSTVYPHSKAVVKNFLVIRRPIGPTPIPVPKPKYLQDNNGGGGQTEPEPDNHTIHTKEDILVTITGYKETQPTLFSCKEVVTVPTEIGYYIQGSPKNN